MNSKTLGWIKLIIGVLSILIILDFNHSIISSSNFLTLFPLLFGVYAIISGISHLKSN